MDMHLLARYIICSFKRHQDTAPPLKENCDFWSRELEGINMDGLDGRMRRLSSTDREIIRQKFEALRRRKRYVGICVSGHIDIKTDIIEFSRRLGATEEEIALDILPSLNLKY